MSQKSKQTKQKRYLRINYTDSAWEESLLPKAETLVFNSEQVTSSASASVSNATFQPQRIWLSQYNFNPGESLGAIIL